MKESREILSMELQKLRQNLRRNPRAFDGIVIKKHVPQVIAENDNRSMQLSLTGMLVSLFIWLRHCV